MAAVRGGGKLEAKLKGIGKKLGNLPRVRVGFLEGATYPDGTLVAMVAAIQEFGAPRARIPPRPYFRTMVSAKKGEWPDAVRVLLKDNDYDVRLTLEQVGAGVAKQLRDSILDLTSPPLSPVTLMLRKMKSEDQSLVVTGKTVGEAARRVAAGESTAGIPAKPLIDWPGGGHLVNSVGVEVKT